MYFCVNHKLSEKLKKLNQIGPVDSVLDLDPHNDNK